MSSTAPGLGRPGRGVQAALDLRGLPVGDRLAQPVVVDDLLAGRVRSRRGGAVEVRGHPLRLRELRVGLGLLRARDDLEQHQRDRHHRDDHDDHEEQPQPVAEGRREEVAKAHAGGGADRQSSRRAVRQVPPPRLQSAIHGARVKSCRRPCGAIAQLGERLDRTQEVGGSSPPSSIARNSRPLRGFRAFLLSGLWSFLGRSGRASGTAAPGLRCKAARLGPRQAPQRRAGEHTTGLSFVLAPLLGATPSTAREALVQALAWGAV